MGKYWKSGFHLFLYEFITSNQHGIAVVKRRFKGFIQNLIIVVILCEIILHVPVAYDIPGVQKPDTSNPVVHIVIILASTGLILLTGLFLILTKTIYYNIIGQNVFFEKKLYEEATFFSENIILKKNDIDDDLRYYPINLTIADVSKRALGYYGMTLGGEIFTLLTVGFEYALNIIKKIYRMYARIGHYGSRSPTPHEFYLAVINTSMATWIDAKSGHFEMKNQRVVYNRKDVINIKYLKVELDHEKEVFVRMFIELEDGLGLQEVVDNDVEHGNTCSEAAAIFMIVGALSTHPHLHFWSNGVGQLIKTKDPKSAWPLAKTSSEITEYINSGPTSGTASFIGTSSETLVNIITWNMNQGLPMHHRNNEYIKIVGEKSLTHKIAKQAKENLKKIHPDWPDDVILCLVVATVYHTADHYYGDLYISYATQSKYLKMDFSFFRTGIYSPNTYFTRDLKCCQHLNDPVCKAIYDAAKDIDESFANEIQIGIMS